MEKKRAAAFHHPRLLSLRAAATYQRVGSAVPHCRLRQRGDGFTLTVGITLRLLSEPSQGADSGDEEAALQSETVVLGYRQLRRKH